MIDSCSPSKLDPGFAATYSNPRALITSTMKSDPGWSTIRDWALEGGASVSALSWPLDGATGAERRASQKTTTIDGSFRRFGHRITPLEKLGAPGESVALQDTPIDKTPKGDSSNGRRSASLQVARSAGLQ